MSSFIKWFAPRYEDFNSGFRNMVRDFRDNATVDARHKRTPENIAKLAIGLKLALDFAEDMRAISKEEKSNLWDRGWSALNSVMHQQTQHQTSSEPARRFIELLRAAITSGQAHIASADGTTPINPGAWGWRKNWDKVR